MYTVKITYCYKASIRVHYLIYVLLYSGAHSQIHRDKSLFEKYNLLINVINPKNGILISSCISMIYFNSVISIQITFYAFVLGKLDVYKIKLGK